MIAGLMTTVIAVIFMLGLTAYGAHFAAGMAKMIASCGFLWTAYAAGAFKIGYGRILFCGLVFSWFGDLFLIGKGQVAFLGGLISFFLAHVAYCIVYGIYSFRAGRSLVTLILLMLPGFFLAQWIWPGVPVDLRLPVLAYMSVISIMVALAVGTWSKPAGVLIVVGAILFYLSDVFVARGRFVTADVLNSLIGLPLYFGGQLVLASSIAWARRPASGA